MEFELLRNITIGQYIPTPSVVHRLDPRAKILCVLLLGMAISVNSTIVTQILLLLLLFALTKLSGLHVGYDLRGLLPSLRALIFLFIIQLFFQGWREPSGQVFVEWYWLRITEHSLRVVALGVLRVIEFFILLSLLTLTTPATQLTYGLELLLGPLRRIGVPVHEIALMNMIALRFIPTLAEELEQIMKAQASRGGLFGQIHWWRLDLMVRARIPLVVPLFLAALRRSEDLIVAMEARNYVSGAQRTRFVRFNWTMLDTIAVTLLGCLYLLVWQIQ